MQQHQDGFPCRSIIAVVGFRFLRLGDLESFLEDAERAAGDGHNDASAEDRLGEGVSQIHTHTWTDWSKLSSTMILAALYWKHVF